MAFQLDSVDDANRFSNTSNHIERGHPSSHTNVRSPYSTGESVNTDFSSATEKHRNSSPLLQGTVQQGGRFSEWDVTQRDSFIMDGNALQRSNSATLHGEVSIPLRGGTLKKKSSLRRGNSLKRSSSRRSSRAGSVRSLALEPEGDEIRSAFYSPVPTTGNPTEILANRFSAWRKVLKDLITYFREIQTQYEQRSKALLKVSNVINNTTETPVFLPSGGINDALQILRGFHKQSIMESNKSKVIENDVILALTGLRSDLQQKIKEIKNLSGDFKNSVDKEMESTRKAVQNLGEALGQADIDPAQMTGKQDPYLLRLAADRQLDRQIDEENYLHQAYLNLESSGRELEAIVVGEIQKSYNAYAGILKREADEAYSAVENLRNGPIAMSKDQEWDAFIERDEHFVDPKISVRQAQNMHYPGRNHELATEVRAGLLERKSKYLKSYTAGWYVLSPTHLHEFKSADKAQAPIMSLYLSEQKLGSHSSEGGSSNKFMLKGRQTGSMHRGHSWVFRAESYDTMMAWYEAIKNLTEKTPQERSAYVRKHARSISGSSQKAASVSSDGAMDEEDEEPFSASNPAVVVQEPRDVFMKRPQPGGRFPSDLQVNSLAQRGLQVPTSPSNGSSFGDADARDRDVVAAATGLPGSGIGQHYDRQPSYGIQSIAGVGSNTMRPSHALNLNRYALEDGVNPYTASPIQTGETTGNSAEHIGKLSLEGRPIVTTTAEVIGEQYAENAPELTIQQAPEHQVSDSVTDALVINTPAEIENNGYVAQKLDPVRASRTDFAAMSPRGYRSEPAISNIAQPTEHLAAPLKFTENSPLLPLSTASPEAVLPVWSDDGSTLAKSIAGLKAANPNDDSKRPSLTEALRAGEHHDSISSISQLHVPGEFPSAEPDAKGFSA